MKPQVRLGVELILLRGLAQLEAFEQGIRVGGEFTGELRYRKRLGGSGDGACRLGGVRLVD
jgi:hypothetical protein